ncbi:hypothetical protein [Sphingomonas sp. ACRSK]|uniref:hypothetical protein n=1 Tax=Sphingomonas sp. ACRSK TaxID=2918213 RepID=UPI001EF73C9A|nr:hypothetical protein [Sphingomonas sp. ACRSK]MCG7348825.1 hypothetical protein [Sphingomonas sp. ACRSK]
MDASDIKPTLSDWKHRLQSMRSEMQEMVGSEILGDAKDREIEEMQEGITDLIAQIEAFEVADSVDEDDMVSLVDDIHPDND